MNENEIQLTLNIQEYEPINSQIKTFPLDKFLEKYEVREMNSYDYLIEIFIVNAQLL